MNEISAMPSNIALWLSEREELSGIKFLTEFPPVKKAVPLRKVTVAVGIRKIEIEDAFAQSDSENVLGENEYCRQALITLRFSIHAPYSMGGGKCHETFADIIDCLTFDSGLNVTSSGCEEISADRQTEALVLCAYADVRANLCPAQSGNIDFPSFLDKTLLCGSHIRNEDIHLSESQRLFLAQPFVSGAYYGTGASSRTISAGFTPRAVIILAGDLPFSANDGAYDKIYSAVAVTGAGSMGAEITGGGFTVRNGTSHAFSGAYPALNEAGIAYNYLALR